MNLYHCSANGLFGAFGDYVYADSVGEARREFFRKHGVTPQPRRSREEGGVMDIQDACRLIGYGIEYIKAVAPAAVLAWIEWRIGS